MKLLAQELDEIYTETMDRLNKDSAVKIRSFFKEIEKEFSDILRTLAKTGYKEIYVQVGTFNQKFKVRRIVYEPIEINFFLANQNDVDLMKNYLIDEFGLEVKEDMLHTFRISW